MLLKREESWRCGDMSEEDDDQGRAVVLRMGRGKDLGAGVEH